MKIQDICDNPYETDGVSQYGLTEISIPNKLQRIKTLILAHLSRFKDLEEIKQLIELLPKCENIE